VAPIIAHTLTSYKEPIAASELEPLKCSGAETGWLQKAACMNENPQNLTDENNAIKNANEDVVTKATSRIEEAFRKRLRDEKSKDKDEKGEEAKTSILSAFMLAQRLFGDDPRKKILIVLSDMIEDSDEYNFENGELTDKRDMEIIGKLDERGELPRLENVFVCIEPPASKENLQKFLKIQNFWLLYLKRSGADADESRYVSSLANCTGKTSGTRRATPNGSATNIAPAACKVKFGLGSDQRSVLVVQGYPAQKERNGEKETWHYGPSSYVQFADGVITEFFNAGNLKACR
jgi:hypothetical protein